MNIKQRVHLREVAQALGKSEYTTRKLARLGKIPSARKVGGSWTFDPERLNRAFEKSAN